jgi:hypothetical protein
MIETASKPKTATPLRLTLVPAPRGMRSQFRYLRHHVMEITMHDASGEHPGQISLMLVLDPDDKARTREHAEALFRLLGRDIPERFTIDMIVDAVKELQKDPTFAIEADVAGEEKTYAALVTGDWLETAVRVDVPSDAAPAAAGDERLSLDAPPVEPKPTVKEVSARPGTAVHHDWIEQDMDAMLQANEQYKRLIAAGWAVDEEGIDDHCSLYRYSKEFASVAGVEADECVGDGNIISYFDYASGQWVLDSNGRVERTRA